MTWHDTTIICVCLDFVVFLSLDTTTITSYDRMYVNIPVFVFILTLARKFFPFSFISMIINWLLAIWSHHQLRMMVYIQSLSSSDLKILLQKKKNVSSFFPASLRLLLIKKQGLIFFFFFDHSYTHIHTVYFYGRNSDSFWVCLVCVFMFSHFFISDPYL